MMDPALRRHIESNSFSIDDVEERVIHAMTIEDQIFPIDPPYRIKPGEMYVFVFSDDETSVTLFNLLPGNRRVEAERVIKE